MTVANSITVIRLLTVPALLLLIYVGSSTGYILAAVIFLGAVVTDVIDGFIARKLNEVTALGAKLDPLVDKILVYSALFSLMSVDAITPAVVFPMFIRDMIVDGLRNKTATTSHPLGANLWGKAKFFLQTVSIICSLLYCITQLTVWSSVASFVLLAALLISLPGLLLIAGPRWPRDRWDSFFVAPWMAFGERQQLAAEERPGLEE